MAFKKIYKRKKKKMTPAAIPGYCLMNCLTSLKVDILRRIPTKILAGLAYVSKSWFRLITAYYFPKTSFRLPCSDLILHRDIPGWPHGVVDIAGGGGGGGIVMDLQWESLLSKTLRLWTNFGNGLLMYYDASSRSSTLDHYNVINLVTGQQAAIAIRGKNSLGRTYAAVAYDPSESCFFRIIQFQNLCLNVYDSETRIWEKLMFRLEDLVVMADWIRECVFFRRTIQRISMSGHLLRFVVDRKLSLEDQASAIDLPAVAKKWPNGCIGLSDNQIKFMAFDKDLRLCIWVLTGTYEWSIVRRLSKIDAKCDFVNV